MSPSPGRRRVLPAAMSFLAPLVLCALVWLPEIRHFYLPVEDVPPAVVETLRGSPATALLDELTTLRFSNPESRGSAHILSSARRILAGELALRGYDPVPISIPFAPGDLERGAPAIQLNVASLVAPNLLLAAYETDGDEAWFDAARSLVESWCGFANESVLPRGFLWNDHAIAARLQVMLRFWRIYRDHADYDAATAATLMTAVARDMGMLAKPGHFTAGTNHGVMQNLALLQAATAWPDLPAAASHADMALRRLSDQMPVFIHDEGIVSEHSAGYHEFGLELVSIALRTLTLRGQALPDDWQERLAQARRVYGMLRRPDGTLPMFGDTDHYADERVRMSSIVDGAASPLTGIEHWYRSTDTWLAPASGYLVAWRGAHDSLAADASQLVVTWASLPGAAHKHADETGVLYWAGGTTWWTHAGYWPYGQSLRRMAVGWPGANAVYRADAPRAAAERTTLVGAVSQGDLVFVDLVREHSTGYTVRRQVVRNADGLVAVFDAVTDDAGGPSRAHWTAGPGVSITPTERGYVLQDGVSAARQVVTVTGSEGLAQRQLKGSRDPFSGWLVVDKHIRPADSLVLDLPGRGWMAMAWRPDDAGNATQPITADWTDADHWRLEDGNASLARRGDQLVMQASGGPERVVTIERGRDVSAAQTEVVRRHASLIETYPKFRSLIPYRHTVTLLILACVGLHLLALVAAARWMANAWTTTLVASQVAWLALGIWVLGFHLAV